MGTLAGPLELAESAAVHERFIVAVVTEDVPGHTAWWQRTMQSSTFRTAPIAVGGLRG